MTGLLSCSALLLFWLPAASSLAQQHQHQPAALTDLLPGAGPLLAGPQPARSSYASA